MLPTTLVGSYPKPGYLLQGLTGSDVLATSGRAFWALSRRMDTRNFQALLDRAVEEAIEEQEEAGLDVLTDGEQRRGHYLYDVVRHLGGARAWAEPHVHGDHPCARLVVEHPLTREHEILVSQFRYAHKRTSRPLKVTLPGPATVADAVVNRHYGSPKGLAFAYAEAIHQEVLALRAAGCAIVQFDDPGLLRDVPRAERWGIEALERCFSGVTGLTSVVHVCRSSTRGRPPSSLKQGALFELLAASKVDQVSLEAKRANLDPGLLELLGFKTVILGCLDVVDPRVEEEEEIRQQIAAALEHMPAGRLQLAPDCGLTLLPREVALRKLNRMVAAARSVVPAP